MGSTAGADHCSSSRGFYRRLADVAGSRIPVLPSAKDEVEKVELARRRMDSLVRKIDGSYKDTQRQSFLNQALDVLGRYPVLKKDYEPMLNEHFERQMS